LSSGGGAPHFVAQKLIPAGTIILREDPLLSESLCAPLSPAASKHPLSLAAPGPRSAAQLAIQLLSDPVQMAIVRPRVGGGAWSDSQMKAFIKAADHSPLKPKNVDSKDWAMALAWASTAKYVREEMEGHAPDCKCHRFKLPRQSSALLPSCWPNTAVVCLHTDPPLVGEQMALLSVCDIQPGTSLTNIADQAWLNLPNDRRQQTINLARWRASGRACHCERCTGKVAQVQEKLLEEELKDPTAPPMDRQRMNNEYDKLMQNYTETQQMKQKLSSVGKNKDGSSVDPRLTQSSYLAECYRFLHSAFQWLTTHPLHPCHWRSQKVRELYLSLVRCDFLYKHENMLSSGLATNEDAQHAILRQIVYVLDVAIRSDQVFFHPMEPMKSLPLLTLLELCTFLIGSKVTIKPAKGFKPSNKQSAASSSSSSSGPTPPSPDHQPSAESLSKPFRPDQLHFDGIGRFDSQAAYLLNLSQLNQHAALIRSLNFPYRRP